MLPSGSGKVTVHSPANSTLTAAPTSSTVLVNSEAKTFEAHTIDGYNYFKLRDLAFVLSGTQAQFEVGWDGANNAITLTSGQPYTAAGGELALSGTGSMRTAPSVPQKWPPTPRWFPCFTGAFYTRERVHAR